MTTTSLLRSTTVLKGTGVTYRQLDHWSRMNAIVPAATIYGSGERREWTRRDRLRLKAIGAAMADVKHVTGVSGHTDLVRRLWTDLEDASTTTIKHGAVTITVTLDEMAVAS